MGTWDIRLIPVTQTGNQVTAAAAPGARDSCCPTPAGRDQQQAIVVAGRPDDLLSPGGRGTLKDGFQIWAINVNGSGLRRLTSPPGSSEYPGT